jgi:probable HAF family extracellular repeat protein
MARGLSCCIFLAVTTAVVGLSLALSLRDPAAANGAVSVELTDLGVLVPAGFEFSDAVAINERGEIAGEISGPGVGSKRSAVVWQLVGAQVTTAEELDPVSGYTSASDIDDAGRVVGYEFDGAEFRPEVWYQGRTTYLPVLAPTYSSVADAINNRGQIVGYSRLRNGKDHAILWANGKIRDLGTLRHGRDESEANAINAACQIVGSSWSGHDGEFTNEHAFLWQKGRMRDLGTLPGGRQSDAWGINDRGQIVGSSTTTRGSWHAVIWKNGKIRDLGIVRSGQSEAAGITNRGQIVGQYTTSPTSFARSRAFLWQAGRTTRLPSLGGTASAASAINDQGQIVGESETPAGDPHAVLWTLVSGG